MGSLHERNPSLWVATTQASRRYPALTADASFDVAVIGAGIAGLSTARLLVARGMRVAVIEAGRVASGATGYTTAKVTALQRTTISEISRRHGRERAQVYAHANAAAVEEVARLVRDDRIDCGFVRAPACTYTLQDDKVEQIQQEFEAGQQAGLNTRLDDATELPFSVSAAVWLDNQGQFHPRQYCFGLAAAIVDGGGSVFESTRATDVTESASGCVVACEHGKVNAQHVVLATHLPFLDRGGFFARAHPYRSYAMAVRLATADPTGMYISAESPTHSVRATSDGWVVLGGEGHRVGHDADTCLRYDALQSWAESTFDVTEVGNRWSAQDYQTVDGLPYVGRLTPCRGRTWVATGFHKWGMTNGTASAMILADLITGCDNPWADTFSPTRLAARTSVKRFVVENAAVGKRWIGDRLRTIHPGPAIDLAPGDGAIAELDGNVVAAYRDHNGELHAVSADCTHLGCRLAFNTAETSWDCPCHGSRFDVDGQVLQGPAVENLAARLNLMPSGAGPPPSRAAPRRQRGAGR